MSNNLTLIFHAQNFSTFALGPYGSLDHQVAYLQSGKRRTTIRNNIPIIIVPMP